MKTFPTYGAYYNAEKTRRKGKPQDFGTRHFRLMHAVLVAAQLGIADDNARAVIAHVIAKLTTCYLDAGLTNPDAAITQMRWQHRPADRSKADWLEATSRLISHAEILSGLCGSMTGGTTRLAASLQPLLHRYDMITDDLLVLCGALKVSPRECVEASA